MPPLPLSPPVPRSDAAAVLDHGAELAGAALRNPVVSGDAGEGQRGAGEQTVELLVQREACSLFPARDRGLELRTERLAQPVDRGGL